MAETKHHTVADNEAPTGESSGAGTAAPLPTPSDIAAMLPAASDTGVSPPPTMSDQNPAPATVPGQDDNNPPGQPSPAPGDSGEEQTANSEQRPSTVKLCRHIKEDGVFCEIPALTGRQYCYRHLRLRGQQMRIARAIAQRQTFRLLLPPLEDLNAVQTALIHVTAALAAGLLDRHHAGQLLYALQQAASNLRFLARAQARAATNPATTGAPPVSPAAGESAGEAPARVVTEYPEFEAEFGLPPGLDLTLPPQVVFPPPEKATATAAATAQTQTGIHPLDRWTKEAIALEELDERRSQMDEKSYTKQARPLNDKLRHRAEAYLRKEREAEWEAEAARRNAKQDEAARRWRSMDAAQQRAFMEGVRVGREEEAAEQREKARAKKPAAKVGEEATAGRVNRPKSRPLSEANKAVAHNPLGLNRLPGKSW